MALALVRYQFFGRRAAEPADHPADGDAGDRDRRVAALDVHLLLQRLDLGFTTLLIAHVMFSISFVVVVVRSRLIGFDRSLEEAAADLGATPLTTFRMVTLPLLAPGHRRRGAARLRALDRRLRDLELQLGHDRDVPALHLRRQPARHPGPGQRARDDALRGHRDRDHAASLAAAPRREDGGDRAERGVSRSRSCPRPEVPAVEYRRGC